VPEISKSDQFTHNILASRRSEILEWVSTIPYTEHHKRISEGRLEGTGEWLFKKEEYCAWRSSSDSKLLLLRGIRKFPHASFIGLNSFLTSLSSWGRQNVHCIKSYRLFPLEFDRREVDVLLL